MKIKICSYITGVNIKLSVPLKALSVRIAFILVVGLGIFLTIPTIFFRYKIGANPFWDTDVYVKAVQSVKSGLDPYYFDVNVPIYSAFPYHPYVLGLMVALDKLISLKFWLILCYSFALYFFIRELFATYCAVGAGVSKNFSKAKFGIFVSIVSLIGGSSVIGVASGNISTFIHFTLIAFFLRSIRFSKSLLNFAALCAVFALVKPYFLAYLLLVLIYSRGKRRGLIVGVCTFITWCFLYFSAWAISSSTFYNYLSAVNYVTSGIQDWGYSFYGIFRRRLGDEFALLAHLVILATSISFPLFLKFRRNYTPTQMLSFFPLICYFVVCINPRMKEYDFGVLIFVSLSSIYLLNRKVAYVSIFGCSVFLLMRQLLLWLDRDIITSIPGNVLYLKYWEVLIAGFLVLLSTKMNHSRWRFQIYSGNCLIKDIEK